MRHDLAMPGERDPSLRTFPARILLVRFGAIGDVVNALLVAGAIREQAPDTYIGWAVHGLARPLVEGNPAVDRVHVWDKPTGWRGFRRAVREVRAEGYDLSVDLQRIAKSSVFARLSGAARVLGFDRARSKEGAWLLAKERTRAGRRDDHVVEQYRDVVRALGLDPQLPPHPLPVDVEAERWATERVAEWGGAPVLLNLGASKPLNRWPGERFAKLAHALIGCGAAPVVLSGGPADRELFAEELGALSGVPGVHDFVGATSLLQLAALARQASLMVSCDTGPMHLAAAVGCPVVALFGPANPARTGPYGQGHVVLQSPERNGERSMEGIEVSPVVAAVRQLLEPRALS